MTILYLGFLKEARDLRCKIHPIIGLLIFLFEPVFYARKTAMTILSLGRVCETLPQDLLLYWNPDLFT